MVHENGASTGCYTVVTMHSVGHGTKNKEGIVTSIVASTLAINRDGSSLANAMGENVLDMNVLEKAHLLYMIDCRYL